MSVDPLTKDYPELTPYQFASNEPISNIDIDGLEAGGWELSSPLTGLKKEVLMRTDAPKINIRVRVAFFSVSPDRNKIQQIQHDKYRTRKFRELGYKDDGSEAAWMKLANNKTWTAFADNLAFPAMDAVALVDGLYLIKGLGKIGLKAIASNRFSTLGEIGEATRIGDIISENSYLPGSSGVYLGKSRMPEAQMRALSDQFGVEFAQIYTAGSGKNGGGGFYNLYSGTRNSVDIPNELGTFLVNHTHPGGNSLPSLWDVNYLKKMQLKGSPQKSSELLPRYQPSVRFNINTETIK